MKTLNSNKGWALSHRTQFCIVALALTFLCGCASSSYRKSDEAAYSLQKAATAVNAESQAIDVTLAAMDDLVNKPRGELKPQYDRFNDALNRLIDSSDRAEKAADKASERSADYFQSWDKDLSTINYEAIRNQAETRKAEVSGQLNTVNGRYRENQDVIHPLIIYFQDIRTALGADLTAGGLQAVKPLASNAEQNARKVQMALARLAEELSVSGARMSSVFPRSEPKGGVADASQVSQSSASAR